MKLTSSSFQNNGRIPAEFAFCAPDLDKCPASGAFTGSGVLAAIRGHVLAQATLTGVYSLNPNVED